MKILKKVITLMLVVSVLVFPLVISADAADGGTCGENLTWSYDTSSKTLTISGSGEMTDYYNHFRVPWKSIRQEAEHVVLPDGLTTIGGYAFFKFEKLADITIPRSVRRIGNGTFGGCTSLRKIVLPEGMQSIEGWTFGGCTSLSEVTIPMSLKSINYECFLGCESLMDVTIPSPATTIGGYAFGFLKSHAYNYDMILRGVPGSPVQSYANKNKLNFISVYSNQFLSRSDIIELVTSADCGRDLTEVDLNADGIFSSRDILVSLIGN